MDEWSFPVELEATPADLMLVERLYELNPMTALPASDPNVYDNHQTLVERIQQNRRRPFADKVESRGILFILMSHFLKHATPKVSFADDRISRVLTYIRTHLSSRLDVGSLAAEACMSKDHFIRVFKKATGETPNAYVTQRKMERAEVNLVTTDLPINRIADLLGYDDYSYFTRLFRKHVGMSPQQYRIRSS